MTLSTAKITGAAYLLPALAVVPFWYVLLFVGNPPNPDYGAMLRLWFFETPHRAFFWYHAALPVVCGAFAATYIGVVVPNTTRARLMFTLGVALALSAWVFSNNGTAVAVSLPLLYGIKAAWPLIRIQRRGDAV